jgi:hypothetical protein
MGLLERIFVDLAVLDDELQVVERASGPRLWDLDENECYYAGTAIESARS